MLLLDDDHHAVWSIDELAREVGDLVATRDALMRLGRAGLVHRLERSAFASRAAAHLDRLPR